MPSVSNGEAVIGTVPEEVDFDEVTTRFEEVTTRFDPDPSLFDDVTKQFVAAGEPGASEASAPQQTAHARPSAPPPHPMGGAPSRLPSRVNNSAQPGNLPQSLPPARVSSQRAGVRDDAFGGAADPEIAEADAGEGAFIDPDAYELDDGSEAEAAAPTPGLGDRAAHGSTWGRELVSPRVSSLAPGAGRRRGHGTSPMAPARGGPPSAIAHGIAAHSAPTHAPPVPAHRTATPAHLAHGSGPGADGYAANATPDDDLVGGSGEPAWPGRLHGVDSTDRPRDVGIGAGIWPGHGARSQAGPEATSLRATVQDEFDDMPPGWPAKRHLLGGRQRAILWMGLAGGLTLGALWLLPQLGIGVGQQVAVDESVPSADVSAEVPGVRSDNAGMVANVPGTQSSAGAAASAPKAVVAASESAAAGSPAAAPAAALGVDSTTGSKAVAMASGGGVPSSVAARVASARHPAESTQRSAGQGVRPAATASASAAPRAQAESEEAEDGEGPESTLDVAAAQQALEEAAKAAVACKSEDGPAGVARVIVSFAPSGRAAAVSVVGAPFAGTLEGECIAGKFRAIHVPEFTGDRVTMYRSVKIR